FSFLSTILRPPVPTLFPYTTPFRSLFVEDLPGQSARLPYRYRYMPLIELYPGVDEAGRSNRMSRVFRWSAIQAYTFFEGKVPPRSEEHTSELQSRENLVCRLLLEKK